MFCERIKDQLEVLSENSYWLSVSDHEWAHDVSEQNYVLLKKPGVRKPEEIIERGSILKLVVKWPLQQGNAIQSLLKEQFSILLNIITG